MVKRNIGPILVAPGLALIFVILVFPLFYTVYGSLYNMDYLEIGRFVGLDNYVKIFGNPDIVSSILRSFAISIAALIVSMAAGLVMALWVNMKDGFFAYSIQIVGLIPWVTSMVVGALLWKWIFDGDLGLFNYLISQIGLQPVNIFGNARLALLALIFVISWRTIGYSMVMILAGLKSIPYELTESGQVDGAGRWKIFWFIKAPLLKTPLLVSSVVLTLSNFNNVTVPMVFTGGGPGDATNVVTMELYRQGFVYYSFGTASALSFIVFAINIVMVALYIRMVKYDV